MLRKMNPIISRRIFTATDPILLLADSNDNEVAVQKQAVSNAANSPRWLLRKSITFRLIKETAGIITGRIISSLRKNNIIPDQCDQVILLFQKRTHQTLHERKGGHR